MVNSVLSAADLAWLESTLDGAGLLARTSSLDLSCADADLSGALQSVRCPLSCTSDDTACVGK